MVPTNPAVTDPILVLVSSSGELRRALDEFRKEGWPAIGTTDPWEAVMLLARRSVKLIVLDSQFGWKDEPRIRSIIEEDPVIDAVPGVFCSEGGGQASAPGNGWITIPKPIDVETLKRSVRRLLSGPFPSEESEAAKAGTRFVHRRRPTLVH